MSWHCECGQRWSAWRDNPSIKSRFRNSGGWQMAHAKPSEYMHVYFFFNCGFKPKMAKDLQAYITTGLQTGGCKGIAGSSWEDEKLIIKSSVELNKCGYTVNQSKTEIMYSLVQLSNQRLRVSDRRAALCLFGLQNFQHLSTSVHFFCVCAVDSLCILGTQCALGLLYLLVWIISNIYVDKSFQHFFIICSDKMKAWGFVYFKVKYLRILVLSVQNKIIITIQL